MTKYVLPAIYGAVGAAALVSGYLLGKAKNRADREWMSEEIDSDEEPASENHFFDVDREDESLLEIM